jgi:predicted RNA-binding protein
MFLSKMSSLDSVEHDPKQLSMLVYFGMDVISKSLISEHLQGKKTSKFIIVFL